MKSWIRPTGLFSLQWWLLLLLTLLFIGITAKLGYWQLSRAQLRESIDAEQRASADKPPLNERAIRAVPAGQQALYQPLDVEGRWMEDWTVFLNRPQNGRPGFWVMTPLDLGDGLVLLVQRGWAPRDPVLPDKAPEIRPRPGPERVQGNWITPPSPLMELEQEKPSRAKFQRVRQNLVLETYERETGLKVAAVMRQTGDNGDGLVRDWPAIASKAPMNRGYAFQWFALSLVGALYFVWFQIYRKIRNARSKQA
jgi:surfeit locus 1 family protein